MPTKITIPRDQWSRGRLVRNYLWMDKKTETDLMTWYPYLSPSEYPKAETGCCLGHVCLAAGIPKEELFKRGLPSRMLPLPKFEGDFRLLLNDTYTHKAALINDDGTISDEQREEELHVLNADFGAFEFVFVDTLKGSKNDASQNQG